MSMNRIDRILSAHHWMAEEDAAKFLTAKYYILTRTEGMDDSAEIQAAMDEFTNELIIKSEESLRGALSFVYDK